MSRLAFWVAAAAALYSYVGFPLLVFARARLRPRPIRAADWTPSVSIIIAARNEAGVIAGKVASLLDLDYPVERLEIILASDGSDDGTPTVAAAKGGGRIRVLDLPRVGKSAGLDAAVGASTGEILVFSDANSVMARDAVRSLVRPLADPEVGGVAGNQVYRAAGDGDATARGERSYWDLDRRLKAAESAAGDCIAATGALYAIRRELFRPIPAGVTDDFYLSLAVIDAGRRLVFAPDAIVYEDVAPTRSLEYRRKVRIMTRGLRCIAAFRGLLDPRRTGFYALELFSHKVLMRTMAVPLLVALAASLRVAGDGPVYALAALAQIAVYGLASIGLLLGSRPAGRQPIVALPAYFVLIQLASLHAAWNLVTGRRYERWEPTRAGVPDAADEPDLGPMEDMSTDRSPVVSAEGER